VIYCRSAPGRRALPGAGAHGPGSLAIESTVKPLPLPTHAPSRCVRTNAQLITFAIEVS